MEWDDKTPIYLQIRDKVKHSILDGSMSEGNKKTIDSTKQIAAAMILTVKHRLA